MFYGQGWFISAKVTDCFNINGRMLQFTKLDIPFSFEIPKTIKISLIRKLRQNTCNNDDMFAKLHHVQQGFPKSHSIHKKCLNEKCLQHVFSGVNLTTKSPLLMEPAHKGTVGLKDFTLWLFFLSGVCSFQKDMFHPEQKSLHLHVRFWTSHSFIW